MSVRRQVGDWCFPSIGDFARALRRGETSSQAAVRYGLAAIAARDGVLGAITALNPAALEEAAARDRETPRGGLHGVPVVIKDNIDVTGLPTTNGCAALAGTAPARDAEVVRALKAAGAVILAKANMSEFAASNGRPGYSSAGGLTRNPCDPALHASGSSSGSAVAVAAGYVPLALGTDTFGSVRGPASVTGCVALRPGHGLWSLDGVAPLAPAFDTVGLILRSASDLPLVMNALAGRETYHAPDAGALHRARLAVPMPWPAMPYAVASVFAGALDRLRALGADISPLAGVPAGEVIHTLIAPVAEAQFAPAFTDWCARTPGAPPALAALLAAMESHARACPAHATSPETLAMVRRLAELGRPDTSEQAAALAVLRETAAGWFAAGIDALVFPTHLGLPDAAVDATVPVPKRAGNPMAMSYLASALGFAEVTVPAGHTRAGLPIGLSFMAPPGSEQLLADFTS